MNGYCLKHHSYHNNSNCPICNRQKLFIIISIIIIVIVGSGIFGYSNYGVEIENFVGEQKNEIQNMIKKPEKIQSINEEHETSQEWKNILEKNPKPTNTSEYSKENLDMDILRQEIHELINIERKKVGVKPLILDSKINSIAQEYAEYMARNDHFAHKDLDGNNVKNRLIQSNYNCLGWIGENIMLGSSINNDLTKKTVDSWIKSKKHYENMIDVNFKNHGLGIATNDKQFHNLYIVDNFC